MGGMAGIPDNVAEKVRVVFGDMAEKVIRIEEEKLGITPGSNLSTDQLLELAKDLRDLTRRIAGEELAERVYEAVNRSGQNRTR